MRPQVTVACVLRSGGEYVPLHVHALKRSLDEHLPGHRFLCLTDDDRIPRSWRVPLEHGLPGWHAKVELCRPDLEGPIFYVDLDMIVRGPLRPMVENLGGSICLRDLYRGRHDPTALQSALMLLTEEDRALVWREWLERPDHWLRQRSDQELFEAVLRNRVLWWQDTHPGMVLGYKTQVRGNGPPPEDCRIVAFHGRPRPWACGESWAERVFRIWTAEPLGGTGKASQMHDRRAPAFERFTGPGLVTGTLNARLDRAFDWTGAETILVPDAASWSDLDGPWIQSTARVQALTIGGVHAWAVRMERSKAPGELVELVSTARLRDAVEWPATLALQ